MKLYKLTDQDGKTQYDTDWVGKTHEKEPVSKPELCSSDVYHAYTNPNLALLLNPIHANILSPRMFECEGEVVVSDWGKVGCYKLSSKKELNLPDWYTDIDTRKKVQVMFAVLCTEEVLYFFEKALPKDDRPRKAIEAARNYVNTGTESAAHIAEAAHIAADAARALAVMGATRAVSRINAIARAAEYAADAAAYAVSGGGNFHSAYSTSRAAHSAARAVDRAAFAADAAAHSIVRAASAVAYAADAARAYAISFERLADLAVKEITDES